MDYEKAYKEALERARAGKPMNEVFPEIHESEDERIRKFILSCCDDWENGQFVSVNGEDLSDIRAYLEKQKEQQPAECLKPEKDCWYVCIKDFYGGGKKQSSKGDLVQAKGGMYMMARDDISEWFRKAYYDEIKPAGWSGEDITNGWTGVDLERYLSCLQRLGTGNPLQPETVNSKWFKEHCRPQPHTVSIKNATKFGNLEYERGVKDGIRSEKNHHWKPSEEQLDALKEASTSWMNEHMGNCELLKSLYNDLKKL